jgi:hypothetical protein
VVSGETIVAVVSSDLWVPSVAVVSSEAGTTSPSSAAAICSALSYRSAGSSRIAVSITATMPGSASGRTEAGGSNTPSRIAVASAKGSSPSNGFRPQSAS